MQRGLLSRERRALTVGLVLVVTLVAFEALAVATAMPVVERDLGGLRLYGLVFSAFMLTNLVGVAYAGREADVHPPATPFVLGLVLFGAGLTVAGLAPTMPVVVAGRAVQGFGAGVISTVVYVAIGRGYDDALRPRMFAVMSSAWVVPGLLGPAIAGSVAEHVSWRLVFLGLLPLLPVSAALTLRQFRRLTPPAGVMPSTSLRSTLWPALGAAGVLIGFSIRFIPGAILLVAGGGVVGTIALKRLLPPGTLRAAPGAPAAIGALGIINLAFAGGEVFLPLTLNGLRGASPTFAGLALTAATITWTAGSWVQARKDSTWSRRSMARAGFGLVLLGIICAGTVTWEATPVLMAAVGWGVAGLGMGLAYSSISLAVLAGATERALGSASASLQLSIVLGTAFGAGIGGAIVATGASAGWATATSDALVFALMAGFAAVGLVVSRRLRASSTGAEAGTRGQ